MKKKITFKTVYLLLVITIGLLGLGLGSTYAMFTKEAEIDNPIAFTSNLSYTSDVIDTIDITLKPTEMKPFSLTINNNTGNTANYAVVYLDENYNIDIYGKLEESTCKNNGTLENSKQCLFNGEIRNDGNEEITVTIAIVSSNSSITLANGMNLIPLKGNLATYVTSLYTNASKTKVTNNSIEYNTAPSVSLMNDRLGGTTTSLDGGNIRYYGASPNNYIYFNCSDYDNQSASSCELWRIIGVFDGKVKIKSTKNAGDMAWDSGGGYNWADSTLKTYLNNTYYNSLTNETKQKILDTKWDLGLSSTNSSNVYSNQLYVDERGLGGSASPTSWLGKIAPMYASDFGYATNFGQCKYVLEQYIRPGCNGNDWIADETDEWVLTPVDAGTYGTYLYTVNNPGLSYSYLHYYSLSHALRSVYPTLYLNPDELIQGGIGSESDPYELSSSYGKYFNGESDYVDMGHGGVDFGKSLTVGLRFKTDITRVEDIISNYEYGGFGFHTGSGKLIFQIHTEGAYKSISANESIDASKWHTAIGTYDGTAMKLYVDGKLTGTPLTFNNTSITKTSAPFIIGGQPDGNSVSVKFKGRISDVFLTNEVLDETTIKNNFTNTFIYDEDDSTYFYYKSH